MHAVGFMNLMKAPQAQDSSTLVLLNAASGLSQDMQAYRIFRLCWNLAELFNCLQAHEDLCVSHLHCDILHGHVYNLVVRAAWTAEEH